MFIIPFTHDRLTVYNLPYVTMGIIVLCTVIFFGTCNKIEEQQEEKIRRLTELMNFYSTHDYVELSEEFLNLQGSLFRNMYEANREWVEWFDRSPDEVDLFIRESEFEKGKNNSAAMAEMIANAFGHNPQNIKSRMGKMQEKMTRSRERKLAFLIRLKEVTQERRDDAQTMMDAMWQSYDFFVTRTILERYAYVPKNPGIQTLVAHIFLHGDIFHLIFNMLFLWLAGVILEDMWGRAIYAGMFMVFGILATFISHMVHPDSVVPHIGSSGAVAGLMGAFLMRQARAKIKFMYFFILLWRPRWGTFNAPAFLMLPLWFLTELIFGFWFDFGFVDHWAHVGGFVSGVAVGAVFLITDFEKRFLGYEPIESFYKDVDPNRLIAFENADAAGERKPRPGVMTRAEAERKKKQEKTEKAGTDPDRAHDSDKAGKGMGFVAPVPAPVRQHPAVTAKPDPEDEKDRQRALRGVEAMDTRRIEEARNMARKKEDGFDSLALPEKFSDLSRFNIDQEPVPGFEPPGSVPETDDDPTIRDACAAQDIIDEGITHDVVKHVPSPRFDGRFASGAIDVLEDSTKPEYTDGSARYTESKPRLNTKEISVVIWGGMDAFEFNEVTVTGLEPEGLEAVAYGNVPMLIHIDDVHFIAAGSIEKLNPVKDAVYFHDGIPDAPIYVMVIVAGQDASKMPRVLRGYFIDGEHLPYDDLLTKAGDSLRGNFWEFAKLIKSFFPDAHFIQKRGTVQREGLPIYATLEEFLYEIRAQT